MNGEEPAGAAARRGRELACAPPRTRSGRSRAPCGPESRTMPRAAGPGGLAGAAMVSLGSSRSVDFAAELVPAGPSQGPAFSAISPPAGRFGLGRSRSRSRPFLAGPCRLALIGDLAVGGVFSSLVEHARPELGEHAGRFVLVAVALGFLLRRFRGGRLRRVGAAAEAAFLARSCFSAGIRSPWRWPTFGRSNRSPIAQRLLVMK